MITEQKKKPIPRNVANAQENPSGLVSDYPMSSVMVVFAIGLGAGVALGSLLNGSVKSRPTLGRRTELAAEQLGRQMLDAIAGVLPASLAKHISG